MSVRDEDIEQLIDEVEKRPPLYLKSLKDYSDINLKKKLWDEVSLAVTKEWNNLTPEDKMKQVNAVQKKWHNLRTCFSRELRAQQATKSGQAASKRRKYVYFDRLLFLLPDVQQRPTTSNVTASTDDIIEEEDENDDLVDDDEVPVVRPANPRQSTKAGNKKECYEQQLLEILKGKQKNSDQTDEETNFALSLVPTLKSLPEENKLQARIEILNVLQRMKYRSSGQPTLSPLQYPHVNEIPPPPNHQYPPQGRNQYLDISNCSPNSNVSELSAGSYYAGFSPN